MIKQNFLLIGMPGTGKSTLGKLLADKLNKQFIDTDALISKQLNMPTQRALDTMGNRAFGDAEEHALMSVADINSSDINGLDVNGTDVNGLVIATGGSAIYQLDAINHLKESATVIHLIANKETLLDRIDNFSSRAIVIDEGMSFADLYAERMPLYQAVADIEFQTDTKIQSAGNVLSELLNQLLVMIKQYDVSYGASKA